MYEQKEQALIAGDLERVRELLAAEKKLEKKIEKEEELKQEQRQKKIKFCHLTLPRWLPSGHTFR